ncbi:phthiocerol/phthiodiolone dimycocerosyl transferase family protein [Saccharothrix deserti]|uniref:phthiocerol/phthiodiolone dimycocerosyl transferase family protein n=1 Tax=Saccharothrix deserti TaxID=2593674 RepID=UPI00131ABF88|nr:condensation domain-containing protein [Saccharothrix deserti]
MQPGRPLSAVEEFVARTGTPVVLGATVHGPLDIDALARAVRRLSDWHPVLTYRITRQGHRHRLSPAPHQPPPRLRQTTPHEPFDAPFAPGDPLLHAGLTRQPDGTHRLVLAIHHAISDGVSALSLTSLLWQTYTALVTGAPEPTPPPDLAPHPATDDLLAHRHPPLKVAAWLTGQALDLAVHRSARLPGHRPGPSPEPGAHLHTTELTTAQAHRLYRTARQHNTTSTALLSAIILLAARTQLPSHRPRRLSLGVTIGLRPCLTPPIPAHRLLTATSFVPVATEVGTNDAPTELASRIDRQLATARDTAHAERQAVALRYLLHAPTPIPFTMMLTNMATHRFRPTLPPGTRLTATFGYAPPPGPVPAVFITRVHHTLALHLATPRAWFDARQAASLAQALSHQLVTAVDDPQASP